MIASLITDHLSRPLAQVAVGLFFLCLTTLFFYRTFLHPLARYPGPQLAAISDWYAAFFAARGDLHIQIRCWHLKYGPIVRIGPNFITFDRAEAYEQIYGLKSNVSKNERYATSGASRTPSTITATDKPTAAFKRKAHLVQWSQSNLKELEARMHPIISTFISFLEGTRRDDHCHEHSKTNEWSSAHDMNTQGIHLFTDLALECTFGSNPDLLLNPQNRFVVPAFVAVIWRIMICSIQPKVQQYRLDKIFLAPYYRQILSVGTFVLEQTKENKVPQSSLQLKSGRDFVTTMSETHNLKTDQKFKTKDMWLEAYLMLGVGAATVGPTFGTVFFYLLHHPAKLAKVTKEVRSVFSKEDDIMSGQALNSLKYMRACIDETLRMVPVLSNPLPREVQQGGTIVEGEYFESGTILGGSLYSLHRNDEYFAQPNTFAPERWLDPDQDKLAASRKAFFPFSTGPRSCVGYQFALAMMSLALARTLFVYDIRLDPASPCCSKASSGGACTDRQFKSYIGYQAEGPMAQFRKKA